MRSVPFRRFVVAVTLPALLAACATPGPLPSGAPAEATPARHLTGAEKDVWVALAALPLLPLIGPAALVAPVLAAVAAGSAAIVGVGAVVRILPGDAPPPPSPDSQQRTAEAVLAATVATIDAASLPAVAAEATWRALAAASPASLSITPDALGWQAHVTHPNGDDSIVRVHDIAVRFVAQAPGTPLALVVTASAESVDGAGRVVGRRGYLIESPWRSDYEWTQGGYARAEAVRATTQLAERVVDTLVLGVAMTSAPDSATVCGLAPLSPLPGLGEPIAVRSLRPAFAWSAMPDAPTLRPPASAIDIRYDLRVWRIADGHADELVVERFGLTEPRYVPEAPLASASRFAWTVRMRYVDGGRMRATPWSAADLVSVPQWHGNGMPYYVQDIPGGDVHACDTREMRPCGCLDVLPLDTLAQFATR